ncbi:MAG: flagellar brake protein [Deltaproteobacteria bacterium]|nr:flagellar brake protein [Deltaproteobacteria bacterium]
MDDTIFKVGQVLSIEASHKLNQGTRVIGWEKDVFILTRAIYVEGLPTKIKGGDVCTVRFLQDGVAYGFATEVISVQYFPYPLMFLKFPIKISCLKLRVAQRYKTDLPATFSEAAGSLICDAAMIDLSEAGCGLRMPVREGRDVPPDADYVVTFTILDQELRIPCRVKSINKRNDARLLGLEFVNTAPDQKEKLSKFIEFLKVYFVG